MLMVLGWMAPLQPVFIPSRRLRLTFTWVNKPEGSEMVQEQNDTVNTASGRLKGDMDRFRQDLKQLGDDFASMVKHGLSSGKAAGSSFGGRMKSAPGELSDKLGSRMGDVIENRPLAVIGTAFAAGILAGMLLKRRH
jgi:ElaB/YqjD/DUF883 family membrane-anchored ribosome-binding protein